MCPHITGQTGFGGHRAVNTDVSGSVDSAAGLRAIHLNDLMQTIDWIF